MCFEVGDLFLSSAKLFGDKIVFNFSFLFVLFLNHSLSIQEFVKGCGSVTKRWVDGLLDKMTAGDHTKAVNQIRQVYDLSWAIYTHYLNQMYPPPTDTKMSNFMFQKRNMMQKPDEAKSNICDIQVCCSS